METVGNVLLHLALVVSFYAAVMSFVGQKRARPGLVRSSRNALWGASALVIGASGLLVTCFLQGKFSVEYVSEYSNSTMPVLYKIAAFWGGQAGSLLFWLAVLCVYSSIVVFQHRNRNQELVPFVITTLMTIATFFLVLLIFVANPFKTLPFEVADGRGLNPLLQNFYMLIHPPSLYLGYVGMSIPFAFAMAALISGRLDNRWVFQVRQWTLIAWFFLSLGNLLGALWAYEVLGWGGYWAWDPVENASLVPWLTATAFLHSIMVQEKRNMLKVWNMTLVVLSFMLTLFGTFLTRSGIISSVHSFAKSPIGNYFLAFLGLTLAVSIALMIYRRSDLRSENAFDSLLSREAAFLLNNLVLLGATVAVLWGTLFPLFSEWLGGAKMTVNLAYFNAVMTPIGLLLLFLTGFGPVIGWRKTMPDQLRRVFLWPLLAGMVTATAILIFVSRSPYVVASFSICAFVSTSILLEFVRGISARKQNQRESLLTAARQMVSGNRRRYGGYVVHLGMVFLFVGFTGEAFKKETEIQLKPKATAQFGRYTIRFEDLVPQSDRQKEGIVARLAVWRDQKPYAFLHPARFFFKNQMEGESPQQSTEVSIKRSLREDLYIAFMAFEGDEQVIILKAFINPLVQFVWIGGLILVLGTIVVIWPTAQRLAEASVRPDRWKRVQEKVDAEVAKRLRGDKVVHA